MKWKSRNEQSRLLLIRLDLSDRHCSRSEPTILNLYNGLLMTQLLIVLDQIILSALADPRTVVIGIKCNSSVLGLRRLYFETR